MQQQALFVSDVQKFRLSKNFILKFIGIAAVLLLFFCLLFVLTKKKQEEMLIVPETSATANGTEVTFDNYADEEIDPRIFFDGKSYVLKKNIDSILFIGLDTYGEQEAHEGNINYNQADVLMLVVLDHDTKTYRTLQINRDTVCEVPMIGVTGDKIGSTLMQIALSHTYGSGMEDSCENTVEAVTALLMDAPIEHYVSLTFDSIPIINDKVGGVTVKIPYDMTAADESFTEGAEVKLQGDQAETFVRSRMELPEPYDTNIYRMERQLTFLAEWRKVAISQMSSDAGFALDLIGTLSEYMVTDMNGNKLSELSGYLAEYEDLGTLKIDGESRVGEKYMEFYCFEDSIKEVVLNLYYDEV